MIIMVPNLGRLPHKVSKCYIGCPEPCEYVKYDVQLSYSKAVSNAFTRNIPIDTTAVAMSEKLEAFMNMSVKERQDYVR